MRVSLLLRSGAIVALVVSLAGCGRENPATPTVTPTPTARPSVDITSMSVAVEAASSGVTYRVVVHLRESAGAQATISSIDLTFSAAATTVVSSHHDRPISDGSNVCPANGTVTTRELVTFDDDRAHRYASSVLAKATYTDGTIVAIATGAADVPAPSQTAPAPTPVTYTLTGVITDTATRAGIEGARLDVLNGGNVGKWATTDRSGTYLLRDLTAETFRLRASATGYDPGEQNVTVPTIPRADFGLRSNRCTYSVAPTIQMIPATGGSFFFTPIRDGAAECAWTASAGDSWVTISGATSGSNTATIAYVVPPNPATTPRTSSIVVRSPGGSATLAVRQAATVTIQYASIATAIDSGPQDGAFDRFAASVDLGAITNNGFTSFATAFEFSLSALPANAVVQGARVWLGLQVDEGLRSVRIYTFASTTGAPRLADFAAGNLLVTVVAAAPYNRQFFEDAGAFLSALVNAHQTYAGFVVREDPANTPNFTVMHLAIGTVPTLSIEFWAP